MVADLGRVLLEQAADRAVGERATDAEVARLDVLLDQDGGLDDPGGLVRGRAVRQDGRHGREGGVRVSVMTVISSGLGGPGLGLGNRVGDREEPERVREGLRPRRLLPRGRAAAGEGSGPRRTSSLSSRRMRGRPRVARGRSARGSRPGAGGPGSSHAQHQGFFGPERSTFGEWYGNPQAAWQGGSRVANPCFGRNDADFAPRWVISFVIGKREMGLRSYMLRATPDRRGVPVDSPPCSGACSVAWPAPDVGLRSRSRKPRRRRVRATSRSSRAASRAAACARVYAVSNGIPRLLADDGRRRPRTRRPRGARSSASGGTTTGSGGSSARTPRRWRATS